jgi:hypothetical protein
MGYEATGKLVAVFETIQRSEKFKTREFVIETTEEIKDRIINNFVKFQLVQDRTSLIDRFSIGDQVKVLFNIKGSRWEKNGQVNYISNLDAWRIESVSLHPASTSTDSMSAFRSDMPPSAEGVDDLPF